MGPTDIAARADALCAAPAGCAFLMVVAESGLAPEVATRLDVPTDVAATAPAELTPWRGDHEQVVAAALEGGARLRPLARAIMARPEAASWFGPLDRGAQLWVPWIAPEGKGRGFVPPITPIGPPSTWERYAQKAAGGLCTSSRVGGGSSALAALAAGTGDHLAEPPLVRYLFPVSAQARVFEVAGPDDWHHLCARFPASGEHWSRRHGPLPDEARFLVPDWAAVARDWDAVHLTLGGLLTAEQVRVEGPAGWTAQWGWDAELTLWLRLCLERVERLPDLERYPEPAADLAVPRSLWWPDIGPQPVPWRVDLRPPAGQVGEKPGDG